MIQLIQAGFGNLAAYLAAHVLLCLIPAFYIAGAMTGLIRSTPSPASWAAPRRATSPFQLQRWPAPCWRSALAPSSRSSPGSTRRAPGSGRR